MATLYGGTVNVDDRILENLRVPAKHVAMGLDTPKDCDPFLRALADAVREGQVAHPNLTAQEVQAAVDSLEPDEAAALRAAHTSGDLAGTEFSPELRAILLKVNRSFLFDRTGMSGM